MEKYKKSVTMHKLMHKINTFYEYYDVSNFSTITTLTKRDMLQYNTLMTVYDAIHCSMEYYDNIPELMLDLYDELGDYIARIENYIAKGRTIFLIGFAISVFLTYCSIDGENLTFPIVCFVIGIICFGISYTLDFFIHDKKSSPFIR